MPGGEATVAGGRPRRRRIELKRHEVRAASQQEHGRANLLFPASQKGLFSSGIACASRSATLPDIKDASHVQFLQRRPTLYS